MAKKKFGKGQLCFCFFLSLDLTLIQGGFFNWCVLNVWRSENDTNKSFDDLKGIQNWSTDFDNPEVYSDTSIFDDLGFLNPFLISL